MVHGLEADYWGRIDFVYLDREAGGNRDVVREFGIRYQPVFVLVDAEGNELQRWFSPDEGGFRDALDDYLAANAS